MRVIFLGTAGYHPTDTPRHRETSCVMLPELGIVFDAGTGFHRVRNYLQTPELHILLSHYHWDHTIGLTYLLDVLWQKPIERVHVWAIHGDDGADREIRHIFKRTHFPVPPEDHPVPIAVHEVVLDLPFAIGAASVVAKMFPHNFNGSLGYRIEHKGRTLVYITDTTVDLSCVPFVQGADILICECNFSNANIDRARLTTHSWSKNVGALAQAANVKRLLLHHVNPLFLDEELLIREVRQAFDGECAIAYDFLEIEA